MNIETTRPTEASERLDGQGWTFIDVRSVPEYEAGHVPGAYNVPLLHMGPGGMQPNPRFLAVVERHFRRDAKLILGCKVGMRSQRACELLASAGYEHLANMDGGFSGRHDEQGRLVEQGWAGCGLPVATAPEDGRTWEELAAGLDVGAS